MKKDRPGYTGYKSPPEEIRRRRPKPTPPPPEKRGLTVDEIIAKYPMSVRILMVQLVEQIERLEKKVDLIEITEVWAEAKAKEIRDLIKQAQDEDLSDPALDLHYFALCVDLVTAIIEELGLKINKKRRGGCPPDFLPGEED